MGYCFRQEVQRQYSHCVQMQSRWLGRQQRGGCSAILNVEIWLCSLVPWLCLLPLEVRLGKIVRNWPQMRETSCDSDRSTSPTFLLPSSLVWVSESDCIHQRMDGGGQYARTSGMLKSTRLEPRDRYRWREGEVGDGGKSVDYEEVCRRSRQG